MVAGEVVLGSRVLLVLVLGAACVGKARSRRAFAGFRQSLVGVPGIGRDSAQLVAAGVVATEAVACLLIFVPSTVAIGFALASVLFFLLVLGISIALARGTRVTCRCFGLRGSSIGAAHLVVNVCLLAVAAGGLWSSPRVAAADIQTAPSVAAAGIGLIGAGMVVVMDDVMELLHPTHQRT